MQWRVEGADSVTGADKAIDIEAFSQSEAEKVARDQFGILVSGSTQIDDFIPDSALQSIAAANDTVRHVPRDPQKPARKYLVIPDYVGLKIAARVLLTFAFLYYALTLIIWTLAVFTALSPPRNSVEQGLPTIAPPIPPWEDAIKFVVFGAVCSMAGALFHGIAAACVALRDLARNSFRP
jgi:hypothetical protein